MPSSTSSFNYQTAEQRWLHRYGWLFVVLGIPLGFIIDSLLWAFIALDRSYLPGSIGAWFGLKGLLIGCGIAVVPVIWKIGMVVERDFQNIFRKIGVTPLLVIGIVALFEILFRSYLVQDFLWQSVRSRSGGDYFAHEISLFRLDEASRRHDGNNTPGVVVAGSSQILYSLDAVRLQKLTDLPVYRRAAAGMFTAEMCGASGFMDFNPDNVFVMMVSGFDVGARPELYVDAMRPIATPGGVRDLMRAATTPYLIENWRTFAELSFASMCDMWRSRDYIRMVYANPLHPKQSKTKKAVKEEVDVQDMQIAALRDLGSSQEALQYCKRVLTVFLDRANRSFRRVVVFEGRVNPNFPGQNFHIISAEIRAMMLELEAGNRIDYVTIEEQGIELADEDWRDMTHVKERGRQLYTEAYARAIKTAIGK